MPYTLSVSPDFSPDHISGWFIFNTWIQRKLGESFHLELYDDFETQRSEIQADKIDLIYANPYDASMLVRDKGFSAVARPKGNSDEAVIVVPKDSPFQSIDDLKPGVNVVSTQDPDVHMMGMIMIEPADLDSTNINLHSAHSYVLVAKNLLNGNGDVGFFLKEAFEDLSDLIRGQMRVLVTSQIDVVHHTLMAGPAVQHLIPQLLPALLEMHEDAKGVPVLESMKLSG